MSQVAVVTGGSRGIGEATCRALAREGLDIVVTYVSDANAALAVAASCEELGVQAVAVRGDVSSEDDVLQLFAAADELGGLSVLVNNAGISVEPAPHRVAEIEFEPLKRMFGINVIGSLLCARSSEANVVDVWRPWRFDRERVFGALSSRWR